MSIDPAQRNGLRGGSGTSGAPSASDRRWAIGAIVVLPALLLLLWALDPRQGGPFPPCPIYRLTGWWCAGCGTLRAIHDGLHGDVASAWRLNPMMTLLLPLVGLRLALFVLEALGAPLPARLRALPTRRGVVVVVIVALLAFTVARNL